MQTHRDSPSAEKTFLHHCGIYPRDIHTHTTCHYPNHRCGKPGCSFSSIVSQNGKYGRHLELSHVQAYKAMSKYKMNIPWKEKVEAYVAEKKDDKDEEDSSIQNVSRSSRHDDNGDAERVSAGSSAASENEGELIIPFQPCPDQYDRSDMATLAIKTACNTFSLNRIFSHATWSKNVYYRPEVVRPSDITPEALVEEADDRLDRILVQCLKFPRDHASF